MAQGVTTDTQFYFDQAAADKACRFFSDYLKHYSGRWAGQPFILQPWQREVVSNIFGWKKADGTRRYSTVYILVPRKAGKSAMAAGLALYLLLCDNEPGAEIYGAAVNREQAKKVYTTAKEFVRASPALRGRVKVYRNSINLKKGASYYTVVSADAKSQHGYEAHGIICDELHVWPNRELYDVLTTSTGSRRQPLTIIITTAGTASKTTIWSEVHEYACKVKSGEVQDDSFYPVIYAADLSDDWKDPKSWAKAQPNLGITVKESYYREHCNKAMAIPAYESTFRQLFLNQVVQSDTRWVPWSAWDACPNEPIDIAALQNRECYVGVDLSATTDMTAVVLWFSMGDGTAIVLPHFWIPKAKSMEREQADHVPYAMWERQGLITFCDGAMIDYDQIRLYVQQLRAKYQVRKVLYDRKFFGPILTGLIEDGFDMVPFGQGPVSMDRPTKILEGMILQKQIHHGGNPILRWQLGNCALVRDDHDNYCLSKKRSTGRIDGIIAMLMALGGTLVDEATPVSDWDGTIRFL
jgi:phage terminase large subunit-like protein